MVSSKPIIFQRPHLQMPSPWELRLHVWIWENAVRCQAVSFPNSQPSETNCACMFENIKESKEMKKFHDTFFRKNKKLVRLCPLFSFFFPRCPLWQGLGKRTACKPEDLEGRKQLCFSLSYMCLKISF